MQNPTVSLTFGLIPNVILCIIGLCIFAFMFPFVMDVYGLLLMGAIGLISFGVSYVANRKIFVSFKDKPTRLKHIWISADWSIFVILLIAGSYTSKYFQHYLFAIGFGSIIATSIIKIRIAKKQ